MTYEYIVCRSIFLTITINENETVSCQKTSLGRKADRYSHIIIDDRIEKYDAYISVFSK